MSSELRQDESDRLERIARISVVAKRYLGDDQLAQRWLERPNRALGGRTSLSMLDTEVGAQAVESVLGRIAYGGVS